MIAKDNPEIATSEIFLEPADNQRLISLCGPFDDNIKQLERRLAIEINRRNNRFKLIGKPLNINQLATFYAAYMLIQPLYVSLSLTLSLNKSTYLLWKVNFLSNPLKMLAVTTNL